MGAGKGPAGKDASLLVGLWDAQEYGWKKSQAHAEHFPNMLGRCPFIHHPISHLAEPEHTVGVQQVHTNSLTLKRLDAERNQLDAT